MKGILPVIVASVIGFAVVPASADVKTYCQAYARDQANHRLTGNALLNGGAPKMTPEEWGDANSRAMADCMALYEAKAEKQPEQQAAPPPPEPPKPAVAKKIRKPAKPIRKKTVTVAATTANLVPGTDAWNDYCDKKYSSFDRKTGTYTSKTGKTRPCRVTGN